MKRAWLAALSSLALLVAGSVRADEPTSPVPQESPDPALVATSAPDSALAASEGLVDKAKKKVRAIFDDDGTGTAKETKVHWGPLYPSLTILSTGASVGPKLQLWQPDLGKLDVYAAAAYSLRQYEYHTLKVGLLPRRANSPPSFSTGSDKFYPLADLEQLAGATNRIDFYAGYRHRYYPQEDFYGIGDETIVEDRSDFRFRDDFVELVAAYHFSPRFSLSAGAGLLKTSLGPGTDDWAPDLPTRFDDVAAPGLAQPPDEMILTAGFLADLRDKPGNPHRGALFIVGVSRFDDRNGAAFEFTRAAGEVRFFLPLGSDRHVIATRAVASFDRPDAGSRVPFYLQSSLGKGQILRGYQAFRFRDLNVVGFSAEYRFEPVSKLELAVFYDAGQVAPERSLLHLSDMHTSYGAGIRFKTPRKVFLRFDVAHSLEGTLYVVKLSQAF